MAFVGFELLSVLGRNLTLVRQPTREIGRRAAELLFERINGAGNPEPRRLVLPTRLVVRGSSDPPPTARP